MLTVQNGSLSVTQDPPLHPTEVAELLKPPTVFTNRANQHAVADLYRRIFEEESLTIVNEIIIKATGWDDEKAALFIRAIPKLNKLRVCFLRSFYFRCVGSHSMSLGMMHKVRRNLSKYQIVVVDD